MSDRLKGTIKGPRPKGMTSTAGPKGWRGASTSHVAYAHRGKVPAGRGDVIANRESKERHEHRSKTPMQFAVPHHTHLMGGAISKPLRATRNPTGAAHREPQHKKRSKTISAR